MSSSPNPWPEYKQAVLDAVGDFNRFYADLKGQKPSTNGHVSALCPFHEDHNPSFTFEQATGNWRCHAGCGEGSVFDFLVRRSGRSFKEEMLAVGDEHGVPRPGGGPEAETVYSYRAADGKLVFQVVRKPGKKWAQRQPDGNGGWTWSLKGVTPVLYSLPELVRRPDEPVYVVEGEKDADRLAGLGLLATTNSGGAGKWRPSYSESLAGREVVILPDNDAAGRSHAQKIAETLIGKAASVRIVDLPDLPAKGDVSDWLDRGGTREGLEALVATVGPLGASEADQSAGSLPVIETYDRPLRDIFNDARAAVVLANDPPQVFCSAGGLARLEDHGHGLHIELMEERAATSLLARVADWIRTPSRVSTHTKPPREAASDLVVNPQWGLPWLDTVVNTPVFDQEWRLLNTPGYHRDARLWLHIDDDQAAFTIPDRPTGDDLAMARSLILDDLFVDFPFTSGSDRAHAVGALLLPFVRRMIEGPTPIHLVEAPVPGSGKSLLAELISIVGMGTAATSTTLTRDESETRKKLTALLCRGQPIISIDNIEGGLRSSQLASAITADHWEDRILGRTETVVAPNRAMWIISGNNPGLSLEVARRCIRIRLNPAEAQPWTRTQFKHPSIREWARQNRPALVRAALTIIRGWMWAGRPEGKRLLGSFEPWSRIIGGIVESVGLLDFLADADEFYAAADAETGEWSAFVTAWWEKYRDQPVGVGELLGLAETGGHVTFAYSASSTPAQRVRFGRSLGSLRDRRFGDFKVVVGTDSHRKVRTFRLKAVETGLFEDKK